jgi:YidC/Oxa1 family membrane protein insertase
MFNTIIYQPLYNLFIFLAAGMIVILFTVIIRVVLYPFSKKAYLSQLEMKKLQPKLDEIRKKYANEKDIQAKKIMEAYSEAKANPFSGILVLFLQIPVIFGLYYILIRSGLPNVNLALLYSFTPRPGPIAMTFFGTTLLTHKNIILSLCAGITSFFQIHLSSANQNIAKAGNEAMARIMKIQMKVMFPLVAFFISWQISGVVGLYWTTTNLFTILQDLYLRKKFS